MWECDYVWWLEYLELHNKGEWKSSRTMFVYYDATQNFSIKYLGKFGFKLYRKHIRLRTGRSTNAISSLGFPTNWRNKFFDMSFFHCKFWLGKIFDWNKNIPDYKRVMFVRRDKKLILKFFLSWVLCLFLIVRVLLGFNCFITSMFTFKHLICLRKLWSFKLELKPNSLHFKW